MSYWVLWVILDQLSCGKTTCQPVDIELLKQGKWSKAGLQLIGCQPGERVYTLEDSGCQSERSETRYHGGARCSVNSKHCVLFPVQSLISRVLSVLPYKGLQMSEGGGGSTLYLGHFVSENTKLYPQSDMTLSVLFINPKQCLWI